jgi:hypothetical protein
MKPRLFLALLLTTQLTIISCDPSTKKSSASSQPATSEPTQSLPTGFPSEIPLFSGSKIKFTDARTPNSELHFNVSTEIDTATASPKQARDFYVAELEKRGWPKGETQDNLKAGNYTYSSSRHPTNVSIITYLKADDPSKTSINIGIMNYLTAK